MKDFIKNITNTQDLLNLIEAFIIILDDKAKVSLVNEKGCSLLESTEKDVIGKDWFDNFIFEENRDEMRGIFKKIIGNKISPVKHHENTIKTRKNNKRILSWHNTLLQDDKGENIGILSCGTDVTKSVEEMKKLKAKKDELELLTTLITDRELKMINMKKEIRDLEDKLKRSD